MRAEVIQYYVLKKIRCVGSLVSQDGRQCIKASTRYEDKLRHRSILRLIDRLVVEPVITEFKPKSVI
jgi:hypothetical protein